MTTRHPVLRAARPRPAPRISRVLAAAIMSWGICTIGAGNARADAAACAAKPAELSNFMPSTPLGKPVAQPFQTRDGKDVTVAEAANGVGAVVNMWATWCQPCIKEMPYLDHLKEVLAKDGIAVVAVSQDRGGLARVEPFYNKHGYKNLDIHLDPGSPLARELKIRGLPTTILFDAKGRELGRVEGSAEWDAPAVVRFIRDCLKHAATN